VPSDANSNDVFEVGTADHFLKSRR